MLSLLYTVRICGDVSRIPLPLSALLFSLPLASTLLRLLLTVTIVFVY